MVQGQMGSVLADYADCADAGNHRSRSGRGQTLVRRDDADEEDRHRFDRGRTPRVIQHPMLAGGLTLLSIMSIAWIFSDYHLLGKRAIIVNNGVLDLRIG